MRALFRYSSPLERLQHELARIANAREHATDELCWCLPLELSTFPEGYKHTETCERLRAAYYCKHPIEQITRNHMIERLQRGDHDV